MGRGEGGMDHPHNSPAFTLCYARPILRCAFSSPVSLSFWLLYTTIEKHRLSPKVKRTVSSWPCMVENGLMPRFRGER